MQEKSIGAIVASKKQHETKFLLLHYITGHWGFPKGHVEENETEEQTLWREIEEETGLNPEKLRILPGFRERITYFYKKENQIIFKEVVFYLIEAKTGKIRLSPEHDGFVWLAFSGAVKKTTFANTKQVLKKANDFLKQKSLTAFS